MNRLYAILTIAGWTWTAIVAVILFVKLMPRNQPRGFEILDRPDEK